VAITSEAKKITIKLLAMVETIAIDEAVCQQVLSSGTTAESIEQELHKMGIKTEHVAEYLKAIRKLRNAKRQSTGFICIAGGAFLGFLSCVLTITHALPDMFHFVFYGLTTLAVCIVVLGLYYIFE
jgi:nucleotidyltransferase/DNA polymerase involved in DNA repair